MTTEPEKHREEAREPERIRVVIRHGKDDWIGIAYAANAGDPSAIHEYVPAPPLSQPETQRYIKCWKGCVIVTAAGVNCRRTPEAPTTLMRVMQPEHFMPRCNPQRSQSDG